MADKFAKDSSAGDPEKEQHREYMHDKELLGDKIGHGATTYEALHFGSLSEEELVHEKKLRKKIDSVIMPLVVLIYLMNYIGE